MIRLGVNNTTGVLSARDFFSPRNAPSLDASDTDFGAGGPVGLPFGTATYPDEVMQAGKDGRIFILNRDNLGGREQGPSKGDQFLAEGGPYAGQWGHPAAFAGTPTLTTSNAPGSSDYLIYAGKKDFMRQFKFGVSASGDKPTFTDVPTAPSPRVYLRVPDDHLQRHRRQYRADLGGPQQRRQRLGRLPRRLAAAAGTAVRRRGEDQ